MAYQSEEDSVRLCKIAYLCIYGLDEMACMIQIQLFF